MINDPSFTQLTFTIVLQVVFFLIRICPFNRNNITQQKKAPGLWHSVMRACLT